MGYTERQWLASNPFFWITVPVFGLALWAVNHDSGSFGATVGVLVFAVLLTGGRMTTAVADGKLTIRYWPIWGRTLDLSRIQNARLIEYKWYQYGGWGIRWGQRAIAYSVWGKQAVRLQLRGRDLVVQSLDARALLEALRSEGVDGVDTTDETPY